MRILLLTECYVCADRSAVWILMRGHMLILSLPKTVVIGET